MRGMQGHLESGCTWFLATKTSLKKCSTRWSSMSQSGQQWGVRLQQHLLTTYFHHPTKFWGKRLFWLGKGTLTCAKQPGQNDNRFDDDTVNVTIFTLIGTSVDFITKIRSTFHSFNGFITLLFCQVHSSPANPRYLGVDTQGPISQSFLLQGRERHCVTTTKPMWRSSTWSQKQTGPYFTIWGTIRGTAWFGQPLQAGSRRLEWPMGSLGRLPNQDGSLEGRDYWL